ncbi:DUF4175 domain-containing protein [Palleronia caenipelagi]|uniref:DUF4175 domain-containing protein n=1 Tax=Palleronia caenipelagi TaxID=2489174 RepID=A0A547Q713_9RHOB|nr:DUF4175 domain-containing protein [Palleronia caenipelagi]TRD22172.1 DUF4175 domain-containing protein [Palleronia caenipelagi]
MRRDTDLPQEVATRLKRPLALTRAGLLAEQVMRAFWPLWTLSLAALAALMLGLQDHLSHRIVLTLGAILLVGQILLLIRGLQRLRWPSRADAEARLDQTLPGRPIAAISDRQAIGTGDPASERLWHAHQARMTDRLRGARAPSPDLRLSHRDPYALRYAALLAFAVALLFGSIWRVGSVTETLAGGGRAEAGGPLWEGWIEPPAYTGRPSLYLADLPNSGIEAPEGSRITLRLYGEPGALSVTETISGANASPEAAPVYDLTLSQDGTLGIEGPGGREWDIAVIPDAAPVVATVAPPERGRDGTFQQGFVATDDYGIEGGQLRITLDLPRIDRRHGLTADPEPREPLAVDLPLPATGDRADIEATVIESFSEHPWANLPVRLSYQVTDGAGQTASSAPEEAVLAGQRFFDPLAQAIIEQRRDLLWTRSNAPRVAQILRAVSWQPDGIFDSATVYLRLRMAIRRLEAFTRAGGLSTEQQDEIAAALWDIATEIEFGDLDDALDRLRRAQERLAEAMENGADPSEIAELMQELREATNDYIRQLAENAEPDDEQQAQGERQEISGDQIQEMMDEIQRLMEEGRMAEAQRLMEQLNRMLENLQVTQGQQGEGQGNQAMEGLQDTLRDQQGLADETFEEGQRQPGQQGQEGQEGQDGDDQSLADRQGDLRNELNRQRGNLPGAGTEEGEAARRALDEAEQAMRDAEGALEQGDTSGALDRQADAMEALRDGLRNLGEALAQEQQGGQGQSQAQGENAGEGRDPLGRESGQNGQFGSDQNMMGDEAVRRRAEELLDEIRRRTGEQDRPEDERDYLRRLLDRF